MKLSLVLLVLVITCCLLEESSGAWRRIRRWRIRIRRPAVRTLSCDFTVWDKNNDGRVDFEEFSALAHSVVASKDMESAFQATDTDSSQDISKSELHKAAFMFGKC
ncbi:uncharacterized protein LOC133172023 [Saccostrea echinata]|uniref:uncharacterized protein LOC133172023 n=1 Tax=Saccostrea echinata TaxID=191078 RepID=UPI002A8263BA|nr:uncharacterized protein LOC133172023 [Saccostrea echinata]